MNALQVMDRYRKEVTQVSTKKNDIKIQYLYDKMSGKIRENLECSRKFFFTQK